MKTTLNQNTRSILIALIIAVFAGLLHAENMFEYPYFQDVEGTNVANGRALLDTGDLSPYTYAYEEPPAGYYVFSAWLTISEPFTDPGDPLKAGRLLMLVFHMFAVLLIYGIAKRTTQSDIAAFLSTGIFIFSPLATTLQRTALLDNIMVVWLLFAFFMIMGERRVLWHYLASAIFFGVAVLTKGSAFFALPAFLVIILMTSNSHHKRFAFSLWAALAIALLLSYPLFALMRQELFPQGWIFSGDYPHVSLWEAWLDRGPDTGTFMNIGSGLASSFDLWVNLTNSMADPILIYGSMISVVFLLILSKDNPYLRPFPIIVIFYSVALLLNGPIVKTDIIAILPFLALSVGIIIAFLAKVVFDNLPTGIAQYGGAVVMLVVLVYPFLAFYSVRFDIYTENQVDGQREAIAWLSERVPDDAMIVTDNYAFPQLRQTHANTHYFWKVDTDTAIKYNLLDDDLCNIDYLLVTPQVSSDTEYFNLDLMRRALEKSEVLRHYPNNGWAIEIRQVDKSDCEIEVAEESS